MWPILYRHVSWNSTHGPCTKKNAPTILDLTPDMNESKSFHGSKGHQDDSFIHVTWLIHMCDMMHDSFIHMTWMIHEPFIHVTWLIHTRDRNSQSSHGSRAARSSRQRLQRKGKKHWSQTKTRSQIRDTTFLCIKASKNTSPSSLLTVTGSPQKKKTVESRCPSLASKTKQHTFSVHMYISGVVYRQGVWPWRVPPQCKVRSR